MLWLRSAFVRTSEAIDAMRVELLAVGFTAEESTAWIKVDTTNSMAEAEDESSRVSPSFKSPDNGAVKANSIGHF